MLNISLQSEDGVSPQAHNLAAVPTPTTGSCFPQDPPTLPSNPPTLCGQPMATPTCDPRCQKYNCCQDIGCRCEPELLDEFERLEAQPQPDDIVSIRPGPPHCNKNCYKHDCCGPTGCTCLAEVLAELERNPAHQGDKNAALRNLSPSDIDLGSAANANFQCEVPCGPVKLGCCLMDTKLGQQCVCQKGIIPTIDEKRSALFGQLDPSQNCSPACQILRNSWTKCLQDGNKKEFCDYRVCMMKGIKECNYPTCHQYATCISDQPAKTA